MANQTPIFINFIMTSKVKKTVNKKKHPEICSENQLRKKKIVKIVKMKMLM